MRARQLISLLFLFLLSQFSWANDPVRILSLDGGGVRGIIELKVLKAMEEELQKPISDIFDMVAGTSTGGIIALGLVAPHALGGPRFSAQDVLKAYLEHSSEIFSCSFCHSIKSLGGLIGPKYEDTGIKKLSAFYLSDTMLSEALIPTLVTGYDVDQERGMEFCSEEAKTKANRDCLMREVAQATAAAPTFFPLATVNFCDQTLEHVADGALYKSNPAILAYMRAKALFPDRRIEIYSIGSGRSKVDAGCGKQKYGGLVHWVSSIVDHLQNCDCASDNDVLEDLMNVNGEQNFFRLDISLNSDHRALDDASNDNMAYLASAGDHLANNPVFKQMIERLRQVD